MRGFFGGKRDHGRQQSSWALLVMLYSQPDPTCALLSKPGHRPVRQGRMLGPVQGQPGAVRSSGWRQGQRGCEFLGRLECSPSPKFE